MIVRIKVEEFYEVEVDDDNMTDAKQTIETEMGDGVRWYLDNCTDYVGRYIFCENAENHIGLHNYEQVDAE